MGLAIIFGVAAVLLTRQMTPSSASWTLPLLVIPQMDFSLSAFIAVSLPMVVLSMILGNVQGLGFLLVQGYQVAAKPVTILVGLSSIVNAMLGGYPAIVGRTAVAILAAPDAGPVSGRYVGSLFAAVLTVALALAASPVTSFIAILPHNYVLALAGLAILSSLQEAFERAFNSQLRFGALIAFVVAATPFTIAGINAAFWAIIAGFLGSLLAERRELLAHWQGKRVMIN
jgi:benzoate membrane transport protein